MKQKSKVVDNKLKAATTCTTQGSVNNFVRVKLHMECIDWMTLNQKIQNTQFLKIYRSE